MDPIQKIIKLSDIEAHAKINGLEVSGSFLKNFKQTIILLSPAYNFWPIFKKSDEYHQKIIDPIDTWSKRVISNIAIKVSAEPKFPFGKNFGAPFFEWAKLSGEAWDSPIGMLVHSKMGLMVSYRGALIFDQKIKLRKRYPEKPCIKCIKKPCINACPIDALTPEGYDIQSCYDFLDTNRGENCMTNSCKVRTSCPISVAVKYNSEHSLLHMNAFKGIK
ncbi:hypothetical protein N9353_00545 [Amylibacter sp.]|nr:hypothetical protein [Amylibacter sp.]